MIKLLKIKDSIQEWVDKVNNIINLNNVDGSFSIRNENVTYTNTEVNVSGGYIRVGYITKTVPDKQLILPTDSILIIGIDSDDLSIKYNHENNPIANITTELYRVKTNNVRITEVVELRTWVSENANQSSIAPTSPIGSAGLELSGTGAGWKTSITVPSTSGFESVGKVWLLGATNKEPSNLNTNNLSVSAITKGFSESSDVEFSYKVSYFSFTTGEYSPSSPSSTVSISSSDLQNFSLTQNIGLTLSRPDASSGILVYRRVGLGVDYKLISVLGPSELGFQTSNISFIDYWTWSVAVWADKDINGYINNNIKMLPQVAPSSSGGGWTSADIDRVDYNNNIIYFKNSVYFKNTFWVYPDHTDRLQDLIDKKGYIEIPRGETWIKSLSIPVGTTLYGHGVLSKIKRLPWCGGDDLHMLSGEPSQEEGDMNFEARMLSIQGNAINQWMPDVNSNSKLSTVKLNGRGIKINNCAVEDVRGSALWFNDDDGAGLVELVEIHNSKIEGGGLDLRETTYPVYCRGAKNIHTSNNTFASFTESVDFTGLRNAVITPNIIRDCGSGLLLFGAINTISSPNVIIGPNGEYIQSSDQLNSEFDSVNIRLVPGEDYVSPSVVYQEGGELFNLSANNGKLTTAINELTIINGSEVIGNDYTTIENTENEYIVLNNSVQFDRGEVSWRIPSSNVNDLLDRANINTLRDTNPNSQGLVYRILQTEYPVIANISNGSYDNSSGLYELTVIDDRIITGFAGLSIVGVGDVVRIFNHSTTPDLTNIEGKVMSINTITNRVIVDFETEISTAGDTGQLALKNTFTIVKGKIN